MCTVTGTVKKVTRVQHHEQTTTPRAWQEGIEQAIMLCWFSWTETCPLSHPVPSNLKIPLSQSHPVPPNMETPLSLSHLSHVLQPVPTSWLYHLSFPNSLFSDFCLGFSVLLHISNKTFGLPESASAPHPVVVALSFQACLRTCMRTSTCACVWTCMHTYAQACMCA